MEDEAKQPGRDGDVPCGVLVLPSGLGCDLPLSVVENVSLSSDGLYVSVICF